MSDEKIEQVENEFKTDCRYFLGDRPCNFHKETGIVCNECNTYEKLSKRILIIKLGALGDVIRTTPLLHKLKELYPACEITWITNYPEILPKLVDVPLKFNVMNMAKLQADKFDIVYSLDKDNEACALCNLAKADEKRGFKLVNGKSYPIDEKAIHKYRTGLRDDLNRQNTKSYVEEAFEMAGLDYSKEKYMIDKPKKLVHNELDRMKRPIIGLNTGCSPRWSTRIWPIEHWIELANMVKEAGYTPLLLGGPKEDKKNKYIAQNSSARYLGIFDIKDFVSLVNEIDLMVTGATMALHIGIALEKKIVLMNNIFNKLEFELYGLGEIIQPEKDGNPLECIGCFKGSCEHKCMELILPKMIFDAIIRQMNK